MQQICTSMQPFLFLSCLFTYSFYFLLLFCWCAHVSFSFFFVRLSSLQVSLICNTTNRLFLLIFLTASESVSAHVSIHAVQPVCVYVRERVSVCWCVPFSYSYHKYACCIEWASCDEFILCIRERCDQTGDGSSDIDSSVGHHTVNHKPFFPLLRVRTSAAPSRGFSNSKNKTHNAFLFQF